MERVQRTSGDREEVPKHNASGMHPVNSPLAGISSSIDSSPLMAAQRKKLQGLFGDAAQLKSEEEPLQGAFDPSQPAQFNALTYAQITNIPMAAGQTSRASMIVSSPSMAAQRKLVESIHASHLPMVQRATSMPIQRVAWTAADTTAAGALAAHLAAGYAAAVASPGAKPAAPAWTANRAQDADPWVHATEQANADAAAAAAWLRIPAAGQTAILNKQTQAAWEAQKATVLYNAKHASKIAQWPITGTAKWNNEAKWGTAFGNDQGFLPGVAGAGGYGEYYCEPSGLIAAEGFWGRNRVLHETTGAGPHANAWFATSDHYDNFTKIV